MTDSQAPEPNPTVEELLYRVVDNAPLVMWAVDTDGVFTLSEGQALQTIGLAPGQVVGMSAYDVYRDSPTIGEHIAMTLTGVETPSWLVEVAGRTFQTSAFPLRDAGGAIVGALGVSHDVTARKQAQEHAEKLQAQILQVQKLESLGVLAGGIAHDFNNLLTAIMGSTAAALMSLPAENPARSSLDNVMMAARRAVNLTRQLLAYAGKGAFEVVRIDLSAHVRELVTVLETTLSPKVQIRLELGPDLPVIEADSGQIQQIIMNLVINGADAIGEANGTVLITTGVQDVDASFAGSVFAAEGLLPGRYVHLEVHDTGCGMDDATKARIFDPFFTTKFHGRGLGLAAVLGIVRTHKGAIKVYSTPGHGSAFKVYFPAVSGQATKPLSGMRSFRGQGLVLVVDDDPGVRTAVSNILKLFGFSVVTASDGRDGVAVFEKHARECVLVILDMTMPVMGGEEAFREIRRLRADVPVILSSGYNEVEATRRFTAKGLAGFLQKPFTPDEIAKRIAAALGGNGAG